MNSKASVKAFWFWWDGNDGLVDDNVEGVNGMDDADDNDADNDDNIDQIWLIDWIASMLH